MQKKEFIKENVGKDKISGRPIRLNRVDLIPKKNTNHAELIFWGDVHIGYPTCDLKRAKHTLEYALDNKSYVIAMGDMVECGLTTSIGDSVYHQKINPQRQMELAIKILTPLAKEGLIIGFHDGNHEHRITNATGINISKIMSKALNVRYLGYACWSLIRVGKIKYSLYSQHGTSGSRFKHTKLKAIIDQVAWINSDIIAMGHVHSMACEPVIKQRYDSNKNKIIEEKQLVILTGSYMQWDNSYAQMKAYPIIKMGSPKIKLISAEKDVHIRL